MTTLNELTLGEHLAELRKRLIACLVVVFVSFSIIMGFYMAHQAAIDNGDSDLIAINNAEQVEKLKSIYTELNTLLRQELEQRYAKLLVPDTPLQGGNAR